MKYDQLQILSDVVPKEVTVLKVDAPGSEGRGWKRTHAEIGTSELPSGWRQKVADGAKYILKETWVRAGYKSLICVTVRFCSLRLHLRFRQVKANDPHYDAKVWPVVHPYGSGSLKSEVGAGGANNYARNRACSIQSWFRKTALWAFWPRS